MEADQILEKISADIAAKFPDWNVSIRNPSRVDVQAPAMLIECEAGNPAEKTDDGDTRIWVDLDLSVKIAVDNLDQADTALSAPKASAALSQFIHGQTWGIEDAKPAEWRGFFSEPFIQGLDHLAYWSVNWSQEFLLGVSDAIHVDEVDELHLGLNAPYGSQNVDKYIEVVDE